MCKVAKNPTNGLRLRPINETERKSELRRLRLYIIVENVMTAMISHSLLARLRCWYKNTIKIITSHAKSVRQDILLQNLVISLDNYSLNQSTSITVKVTSQSSNKETIQVRNELPSVHVMPAPIGATSRSLIDGWTDLIYACVCS